VPLKRCQEGDRPGWKWGDAGKCYTYESGNEESEKAAKVKASKQGIAMGDIKVRAEGDSYETRVTAGKVELRMGPNGPMAVGYAFRYGVESENLGGFVERVAVGAATKTVQEQDLRALFNHDPDNLLGRMGAKTLRVADDGTGLGYQIDLPDTSLGRDLATLMARGDIYGSSFSFMVVGANGVKWGKSERGYPLREIQEMRMRDVGPVTFPAYPINNDVRLRSIPLHELAELRSLPFEDVIAAAASNQLSDLLDGNAPRRPSEPHLQKRWH
jgi:HK97 family phage prohead protease